MSSWIPSALLVSLVVFVASGCAGAEGEALTPESLNPTYIQTVVIEEKQGVFYAVVEGWLPDACSSFAGSEQRVEGNTIFLTIYSTRPEGVDCAQVLVDFSSEIPLETEGLEPGSYRLVVNEDNAETTFTLQ